VETFDACGPLNDWIKSNVGSSRTGSWQALMRRRTVDLWSPTIGAAGSVIAYGHWGRPVLVFPHEMGRAEDFESWGMVDVVADLIDGRPGQALLRGELRQGELVQ
jgi:hypothetical protein